ncbi:hydrogenase [Sulfurimonas lithotrophica]|uniref:Hydrogenase n=1 Tax=Sulfurimonas lithotrophica TaxID=2590022 RepID=A0A5P8NZD3_9BACT|nr:nitrogen fixation protein NifQ [Sulfurimonas lithotrophica]QFR48802.1 hydrogenase [Sulfurimonas lithotrophica]
MSEDIKVLEAKVANLLQFFAKDDYSKNKVAPHIAKVSLEMNHLYQDLGFKSRVEMGKYMSEHFPKLSRMKPKETLWKKYLYDLILETAPACAECRDQDTCFACRV